MKKMLSIVWVMPLLSLSFAVLKHVEITSAMNFDPSVLEITVGDSVRWTNNHSSNHTVTSTDSQQEWDDPGFGSGDIFELGFNSEGTFPYDCFFHSSMTGTIIVNESLGTGNASLDGEKFKLYPNFPNPFNPITNIEYSLLESSVVELIIYNIQGQQVHTLLNDYQTSGDYSINWDATLYQSGIYLVKMIAGEYVGVKKLMLIK